MVGEPGDQRPPAVLIEDGAHLMARMTVLGGASGSRALVCWHRRMAPGSAAWTSIGAVLLRGHELVALALEPLGEPVERVLTSSSGARPRA